MVCGCQELTSYTMRSEKSHNTLTEQHSWTEQISDIKIIFSIAVLCNSAWIFSIISCVTDNLDAHMSVKNGSWMLMNENCLFPDMDNKLLIYPL